MKLEATCPGCLARVPLDPLQSKGLGHVYGGKCPCCHESRLFDVVQRNGATTIAPKEVPTPVNVELPQK